MYRLRSYYQSVRNSLKCLKIQYPKKIKMQEVQMALMQEPITEINKFSTEKLQKLSHTFRLSRQDNLQSNKQVLKFDGKLHLDLKVDKLLLQIQQCKVNLAQILEMYLPNSSNLIQFKQLTLSNLKPSLSQQNRNIQQKQLKNIQEKNDNGFWVIDQKNQPLQKDKTQNLNLQKQKTYNKIRRQDSYEINTLEEIQKNQQSNKQSTTIQQKIKQQTVPQNLQAQDIHNLKQKKQEGNIIAQTLKINEQKISSIAQDIAENEIKNSSINQLLQIIAKQLTNFKKTLMLRQAQLGMLIFITQMKHDQLFIAKYKEAYDSLRQYVISVEKVNDPINIFILEEVFEIQYSFLTQYIKAIQQIKQRLEDFKLSEKQDVSNYSFSTLTRQTPQRKLEKALKSVLKLKIINSKIITMAEIFPYACVKDMNDLFSCSKSHARWEKLIQNDIISYKIFGQPEKVRKSFDALKSNLNIINASMNILNQSKNLSVLNYKSWGKIFDSTSKIFKVALFKSDALHQASVMISEPDEKLAKQIWNLPQNKTLQNFIAAVLPAIQFSEKIYLPRVLGDYFKTQGKQALPDEFYISHVTKYGNELYEKAPYQKKIPCRINAKHRINRKYQTKTKDQNNEQKRPETYSKMFFNTLNSMTKAVTNINSYFKKQGTNSPTAILHIHGGGFISMSSFIHQTYTRNWANRLQVPILSVDYGKAPEYPYPNGLYDCLQAYLWLRFVFRQVYNTQVQRVIIVGDSAGGNIAAALTTLLIQWNLPKPDGLVLVYPALNLSFNNYTPSLLHALNDMILPHTFLKICLSAYIKDPSKNPQTDSLLSPLHTKPQTLKKYPKTKIFVGGKDPFHDDCCRFVQKLNELNKGKADLTILDQFPHGFLQFDMSTYPHQQARKAIKEVQNSLKQLIGSETN